MNEQENFLRHHSMFYKVEVNSDTSCKWHCLFKPSFEVFRNSKLKRRPLSEYLIFYLQFRFWVFAFYVSSARSSQTEKSRELKLTFWQIIALFIYRLFFHPLAKYPGPFLAKLTDLYAVYHAWKGDLHLDVLRCHDRNG